MKIFSSFLFMLLVCSGYSQLPKLTKWKFNPVICTIPPTDHVNHHVVPYNGPRTKINARNTRYIVRYSGPVPPAARTAMDEVTRRLGEIFPSDERIILSVTYASLQGSALAGASAESWYSNFPNTPKLNAPYPVALAEKIARQQLNDSNDPDIFITVNQDQDWYYDFNSPGGIGNNFDFVSVLLHEIIHGLGFTAQTVVTDEGNGFVGVFTSNRHSGFVDFMVNGIGVKITDVSDGTADMAAELQSNNLFFQLESSEDKYKLYAPSTYDPGSSISHLDESTFNNTANSLMTPFVSRGEVEGDPGVSTELLYDLGWNYTYINHVSENLTVEKSVDEDFIVIASAQSDNEVQDSTFFVHYTADNFTSDPTSVLIEKQEDGSYLGTIPADGTERVIKYFFTVEDARGQTFRAPGVNVAGAPMGFEYTFGPDRIAPSISHTVVNEVADNESGIDLFADVVDGFTGVDTVFIEWRFNGVDQSPVPMMLDTTNTFVDDRYIGRISFNQELSEQDTIEYRLRALDSGSFPNLGRFPRGESYIKVTVVPSLEPTLVYINDFDTPNEDFEGDFEVNTPIGFNNPSLNSPHPYPAAGADQTLDFVANLRVPIIVDNEHPIIEFREIVLVEPGEVGTTFGEEEFWDYVVIEGRRLGGSDWKSLLDGYDSRARSNWLTSYNAGVGGNDSSTPGNPVLYVSRNFDITAKGDFVAGDTIQIRFRLFSDPFARGWGWSIDDLKIQQLAVDVIDQELDEQLTVFPNPISRNALQIKFGPILKNDVSLSILDMSGKVLLTRAVKNSTESIPWTFPAGTYILHLQSLDGVVTRKLISAE